MDLHYICLSHQWRMILKTNTKLWTKLSSPKRIQRDLWNNSTKPFAFMQSQFSSVLLFYNSNPMIYGWLLIHIVRINLFLLWQAHSWCVEIGAAHIYGSTIIFECTDLCFIVDNTDNRWVAFIVQIYIQFIRLFYSYLFLPHVIHLFVWILVIRSGQCIITDGARFSTLRVICIGVYCVRTCWAR